MEDKAGEELGVEVGRFGWHLFQRASNIGDVVHRGGRHKARQVGSPLLLIVKDFFHQMDVLARWFTKLSQQMIKHQHMQTADSETSPGCTLLGCKCVHQLFILEACDAPLIVSLGTEPEHILGTIHFEVFPGLLTGFVAGAHELHIELWCQQLL